MITVTCLQSLHFTGHVPSHVSGVETKAGYVRTFYKTAWPTASMTDKKCPPTIAADTRMREAAETVNIIRSVTGSDEETERWLSSLTKVPHSQLASCYPLLAAVFLVSRSSLAVQLSLELLLSCTTSDQSLSTPLLSLILHKLAADTKENDVKLSLFHALPSMATDKTCISLILKLVSSLAAKPSFAPLRLHLLYKLWKVEPRAYPFLQKALLEHVPQSCSLEFQITQTVVIRDILRSHASQLGSDLLPVLSNILNSCSSVESGAAARYGPIRAL